MERRTGSSSSDSPTPQGPTAAGDLPGEALARTDLPEPGAYVVADDETTAEELTDDAATSDEVLEIEDPDQLEQAEADARADDDGTIPAPPVAQLRTARPVRRRLEDGDTGAPAPVRRDRHGAVVEPRTTPGQFVGQSVDELKKVVWPTGTQVRQYFVVVLVFVLFVIAYVLLLDTGFGAALLQLLG